MGEVKDLREQLKKEYKIRLQLMDDEALFRECVEKLRLNKKYWRNSSSNCRWRLQFCKEACIRNNKFYIFEKALQTK